MLAGGSATRIWRRRLWRLCRRLLPTRYDTHQAAGISKCPAVAWRARGRPPTLCHLDDRIAELSAPCARLSVQPSSTTCFKVPWLASATGWRDITRQNKCAPLKPTLLLERPFGCCARFDVCRRDDHHLFWAVGGDSGLFSIFLTCAPSHGHSSNPLSLALTFPLEAASVLLRRTTQHLPLSGAEIALVIATIQAPCRRMSYEPKTVGFRADCEWDQKARYSNGSSGALGSQMVSRDDRRGALCGCIG